MLFLKSKSPIHTFQINYVTPVHRVKGNSTKELNKAVNANMHELAKAPKKEAKNNWLPLLFQKRKAKRKSVKKAVLYV